MVKWKQNDLNLEPDCNDILDRNQQKNWETQETRKLMIR